MTRSVEGDAQACMRRPRTHEASRHRGQPRQQGTVVVEADDLTLRISIGEDDEPPIGSAPLPLRALFVVHGDSHGPDHQQQGESAPGAGPDALPCDATLGLVLNSRIIKGIVSLNGRSNSDGLPSPVPK